MPETDHRQHRGPVRRNWVWLLVAIGIVLVAGGIVVALTG
jgi:hypothetical protein